MRQSQLQLKKKKRMSRKRKNKKTLRNNLIWLILGIL